MGAPTLRAVSGRSRWLVALAVSAMLGCDGSARPGILLPDETERGAVEGGAAHFDRYETERSMALAASGLTRTPGSWDDVPVLLLPKRTPTSYADLPDGLRRCVAETLDALAGIGGAQPADAGCTFEGSQGSIGGDPPATWSVTCFAPNGCRCTISHGEDGHFSTCSCPGGD